MFIAMKITVLMPGFMKYKLKIVSSNASLCRHRLYRRRLCIFHCVPTGEIDMRSDAIRVRHFVRCGAKYFEMARAFARRRRGSRQQARSPALADTVA